VSQIEKTFLYILYNAKQMPILYALVNKHLKNSSALPPKFTMEYRLWIHHCVWITFI